jgi:hypothetical protein
MYQIINLVIIDYFQLLKFKTMKDYKKLTANIQRRTNPENIPLNESFKIELSSVSYSDVFKYVRYAMKGVDLEYTQKSKLAGDRVQNHLKEKLTDVIFRYQGSVMTNTHIRGASDIDLLVICDKFYTFDRASIERVLKTEILKVQLYSSQIQKLQNEINNAGYSGNAVDDLKKNRKESEEKLLEKYDICDVCHPKAIKITNQNLSRDVDVVIANWYDNLTAVLKDKESDYRGIQVYNKDTNSKGSPDYPFLSISRINERSSLTVGRLKKMIRFLKNLKADSDHEIKLSSFDINAICYDIDINKYINKSFYELVPVLLSQLKSLSENKEHSDRVKSVDGNEDIFKNKPEKLEALRKVMIEVNSVLTDLKMVVAV